MITWNLVDRPTAPDEPVWVELAALALHLVVQRRPPGEVDKVLTHLFDEVSPAGAMCTWIDLMIAVCYGPQVQTHAWATQRPFALTLLAADGDIGRERRKAIDDVDPSHALAARLMAARAAGDEVAWKALITSAPADPAVHGPCGARTLHPGGAADVRGEHPRPRPDPGGRRPGRQQAAAMTTAARRLAVAVLAAVVAIAAASCSWAAGPLPARICGTTGADPVRVPDLLCETAAANGVPSGPWRSPKGPVRWWWADARCLDEDDRTPVGARIDDDYLGEPCDLPPRRRPAATGG